MNTNTYGNFYTPYSQNPQFRYPEPQPTGLKGRPVSSIEEAKGSIIDFDGSVFFFPDLANQKIYTKQITADGTALLKMYELKETLSYRLSTNNPNAFLFSNKGLWIREGVMPFACKRFNIGYSYDRKRIVIPERKWDGDDNDYIGTSLSSVCRFFLTFLKICNGSFFSSSFSLLLYV